jgi:hypothetical protein
MREMRKGKHEFGRALALTAWLAAGALAVAEQVQHLSITQPGGMPGWPVMTGIQRTNDITKLTWDGPSGYYQLYYKTNLASAIWLKFGSPNLNRTTNVISLHSNIFFRVSGPAPQYTGAQTCLECHPTVHSSETLTPHARAFIDPEFVALGGQTNSSCLPCHTVGYGLPSGFKSSTDFRSTNRLAGVQCENCHGPAANHAANEMDLTARPRVDIAAQVCGGCHSGDKKPTFEEWNASAHAIVTEDMNPVSRINSCGRCHSGTARLAMVNGLSATTIANTLTNDANVPITCVVCHDPHALHSWTNVMSGVVITNQLRYPTASTNYFSLSTSATFSNRYDINVCAQCHNDRGAAVGTTSRAPHHSPQYNLLMGTVGVLPGAGTNYINCATNAQPGAHAGFPSSAKYSLSGTYYLTNQCVSCHMQPNPAPDLTHSHRFELDTYTTCLQCHPATPDQLVPLVMFPAVSNRVYALKRELDTWASTIAPPALRSNGVLAWEYTTPGGLDWKTNAFGIRTGWYINDNVRFLGPPAGTNNPPSGQYLVVAPIQQARFNLYLVLNDGSWGAHNPQFALKLLDNAYYWVVQELFQ